jgi:hypothetical protein
VKQLITNLILTLTVAAAGVSVLINGGVAAPGGGIFVSFDRYAPLIGWGIILLSFSFLLLLIKRHYQS